MASAWKSTPVAPAAAQETPIETVSRSSTFLERRWRLKLLPQRLSEYRRHPRRAVVQEYYHLVAALGVRKAVPRYDGDDQPLELRQEGRVDQRLSVLAVQSLEIVDVDVEQGGAEDSVRATQSSLSSPCASKIPNFSAFLRTGGPGSVRPIARSTKSIPA